MTSTQEPRLNEGNPATELNAEQALGLVSYGLMQRLAGEGHVELPWLPSQSEDKSQNLHQLRQRLELTALALQTGAPLSTAEVGFLLGARPGKLVGYTATTTQPLKQKQKRSPQLIHWIRIANG